jgi:hypothetical protein
MAIQKLVRIVSTTEDGSSLIIGDEPVRLYLDACVRFQWHVCFV